jgi:hypothetical protein
MIERWTGPKLAVFPNHSRLDRSTSDQFHNARDDATVGKVNAFDLGVGLGEDMAHFQLLNPQAGFIAAKVCLSSFDSKPLLRCSVAMPAPFCF